MLCLLMSLIWLTGSATPLQAPQVPRVAPDVAMANVVTRVDPVLPIDVTAAKVGGDVIADVVIRADGTVESVTMVAGAEPLRGPVAAALRKWRFRPVLVGGRAARVVTLITIAFADPTRDEALRINQAYFAQRNQCQRRLESAPRSAIAECAELVRLSDQLPADSLLERSNALDLSAQSLVMGGRVPEGLAQLERGIEIRLRKTGPDDAGLAGSYRMLALVHHAMKDLTKADEVFALSARTYERAIERLPALRALYVPSLRVTLLDHAAVKRLLGQPEAAQALELRAAGLVAPASVEATPMRVLDSVPVIGEAASRLGDDDVRQIRALLSKTKTSPWFILAGEDAGPGGRSGAFQWWIHVHLAPDVATPALRRGRIAVVGAPVPARDAYAARGRWELVPLNAMIYAQVPIAGRDPSDVTGERDPNRPFQMTTGGSNDVLTDADILGLVRFLRSSAKPAAAGDSTSGPPRLYTDLQPWTITDVFSSGASLEVRLIDPSPTGTLGQRVTVRRLGGGWAIEALNPMPLRPR